MGVFFAGLAIVSGGVEFWRHTSTRDALRNGDYTEVEGVVQGYNETPRGIETWFVVSKGQRYEYRYSAQIHSP
jgi:hypothetical protein